MHRAIFALVFLGLVFIALAAPPARAEEIRRPAPDAGFHIRLANPDATPIPGIGVYQIDLFDTAPETIGKLHAAGGYVICYFSAGSWEDWRPDAHQMPKALLGNDYEGWPGERWLNIADLAALGPILAARLDLAKAKGCDAVDPDNIDAFENDTGFDLAVEHGIALALWLAEAAHARGLAVGQKNAPGLTGDLVDSLDFAVIESCSVYGFCADLAPYAAQGKAVFQIEYRETSPDFAAICAEAKTRGFTALLAPRNLDGSGELCPR